MEKCDEVIFMNSVMRPILINKEEFYLAYTHGDINISEISKYLENQNEEQSMMKKNSVSDLHNLDKNKSKAFDLGRIELFPKNVSQGSYYKYSSDQVLLSTCINKSVLSNEKLIINKIIQILSGGFSKIYNSNELKINENSLNSILYANEIFKLIKVENEKINLKISIQTKSMTLLIFDCVMKKINLSDEVEYLGNIAKYYKDKISISNIFTKKLDDKIKKNDEAIKSFHKINIKLEEEESFLLENMSNLLNKKKNKIRELAKSNQEINNIQPIPNFHNNHNNFKVNNIIEEDGMNISQTLSLSDL